MEPFERALDFVLAWEGGYTNDPLDPGGATNLGITQREYDQWRWNRKRPARSVREIALDEARAIYRDQYWTPCRCGELHWPLSCAVFDTAVNLGVGRGIRFLQRAIGVTVDGVFGPKTRAAVAGCDPVAATRSIAGQRKWFRWWRVAQKPSQVRFLRGWLNRDNAVRDL